MLDFIAQAVSTMFRPGSSPGTPTESANLPVTEPVTEPSNAELFAEPMLDVDDFDLDLDDFYDTAADDSDPFDESDSTEDHTVPVTLPEMEWVH